MQLMRMWADHMLSTQAGQQGTPCMGLHCCLTHGCSAVHGCRSHDPRAGRAGPPEPAAAPRPLLHSSGGGWGGSGAVDALVGLHKRVHMYLLLCTDGQTGGQTAHSPRQVSPSRWCPLVPISRASRAPCPALPQDPTPLYSACRALTSLTLSNNYMLRPESLLPLLDSGPAAGAAGAAATTAAAAAVGQAPGTLGSPPMLPCLRELDVSYCPLPQPVLAALLTRGARLHSLSINGCRGGVTDALWPLLHRRAEELCEPGGSGSGSGGGSTAGSSGAASGQGAAPGTPPGNAAELPAPPFAAPGFRGWAPKPAGPVAASSAMSSGTDPAAAVEAAAEQLAATAVASQSSEVPADEAAPASAAWLAAAEAAGSGRQQGAPPPAQQQQQVEQQQTGAMVQHQLRALSMVGSKELRCFCLGLAPAAAALERGLLLGGGTVVVQGGQQYALVATPLSGLRELRLSLSGGCGGVWWRLVGSGAGLAGRAPSDWGGQTWPA